MKKNICIISLVIAGAFFIGCGDSDKTELSFTNDGGSDGAINDIIWASGDAKWETTNGYALNSTTEPKEVNAKSGDVTCNVITNGGVFVAEVIFQNGTFSLSLADGEANNYTLKATSSGVAASAVK